jgi:hypothetical protein
MQRCLTAPIESNWGDRYDTPDGPLFYRDNGAKVLGVAHLDSVMFRKPRFQGDFVQCPQLDDRLGVWILLDALPKMNIPMDVLLTTGEESCRSTAQFFMPDKTYNWVVEFDRAGSDVVFYQYEDFAPYWHDWDIGIGSYSDICVMEHLGVLCANVGIGYHQQHTKKCWADLRETNRQIRQFARFYEKNRNNRFEFDPFAWAEQADYWTYF